MLVWGINTTLLGVCTNFAGFTIARAFLGITESGLFPGVVFYLSMWYKRSEVHYRVALFFSAASLAGAFGGIFAYGIGFMKGVGGLNGWKWIFILVFGAFSLSLGSIANQKIGRSTHSSLGNIFLLLHPQLPGHSTFPE